MNKFHKIFAGLFASLALTAFVATGAMAQSDSDTAEVTVTANDIVLYEIVEDSYSFSFGDGDFTAGQETADKLTTTSSSWTTNIEDTVLTVCALDSFDQFADSSDNASDSYLIAEWGAANDPRWAYAQGGGEPLGTLVDDGGTDPNEDGSSLGSGEAYNATDCGDDATEWTYHPSTTPSAGTAGGSTDPNDHGQYSILEAQYDIADGNFGSESITIQATLAAQ